MTSEVWMAVDVGTVRVGLAATDPDRILAFPVDTLPRDDHAVERVAAEVAARGAGHVFVGLPRTLSGGSSGSTDDAREFATALAERTDAIVRLVDERLSTTSASRTLRDAGRSARKQRSVIDQAAAVVILDNAIDIDRLGNLSTVTVEVVRKGSHDGLV